MNESNTILPEAVAQAALEESAALHRQLILARAMILQLQQKIASNSAVKAPKAEE